MGGKNNGETFQRNPGVRLLEKLCGMTMHGDREGANALLRSAPQSLVQAFSVARKRGCILEFFKQAFDRTADPCLEGRTSRLLDFLEAHQEVDETYDVPPWEEVSLRPLRVDCEARVVVAEHLRVFMAECTWRWSRKHGLDYEAAKRVRLDDDHAQEFSALFNAVSFEAAVRARGAVDDGIVGRWEVATDRGGWTPFDDDANTQLEIANGQGQPRLDLTLGPRGWRYVIDFHAGVQLNPKTGRDRPIRRVEQACTRRVPGTVTGEELRTTIKYFVDLDTLPSAPLNR